MLSRVFYAIMLYVLIIFALMYTKPALLFNAEGEPKKFGMTIDAETSIFAPIFLFPLIAFFCYYLMAYAHVYM